jgi:3D (Asp-Asp-Asp) domain-containing protein
MSNPTSVNLRRVNVYGATLAAVFVVSAVGISIAFIMQHKQRDIAKQTTEQVTIAQMVHTPIKLSSRSGGIIIPPPIHRDTWKRVKVTWYSSLQGINGGHITATGTHVRDGWTCAVDPNVIPLGSTIEVRFANGTTHEYKAVDTGSAIRDAHIDIYESNNETCIDNGVQVAEYRIVDNG